MKLSIQSPREFINPLLSKKKIDSKSYTQFTEHLSHLLKVDQSETEEHQKNAVRDFLNEAFNYKINTKDKIDWAIFVDGKVEVIIESKSLTNKNQMMSEKNANCRALHETILYYSREKQAGTTTIRHIIIQTVFDWYIFDANEFHSKLIDNPEIKKLFKSHSSKIDDDNSTAAFYSGVERILNDSDIEICCAHFDLESANSSEMKAIYKLLSSDTLLKQFNPNDANALNREFYNELLYILGLEESKAGGKKIISHASVRQSGSLFENITNQLKLQGKPNDFESAIRLIIIWVNRLLFLKLLESQIVSWSGDVSIKFLHKEKIALYDKLNSLFFEVLAKKVEDRSSDEFKHIPYLNSSLFERHADEDRLMLISSLSEDASIDFYNKTVVKNSNSKRETGSINTLEYLFKFLDAFDFSNENSDEVVTEQKSLINASVLGLIFEKINGYKDGSFYTPSFITMYMARESITKAVLDKFNAVKKWECKNLTELHNKISDIAEANNIINSVTICDPAVGSGHFLVSALNELIYIKSELGVLIDETGKRLKCTIRIENDELIIIDDEGESFTYEKSNTSKTRIQKTLFNEKQTIIENCLFGVDINPNSVNICRLRLWIELLKNAYYKDDGKLETLPNIDINIKCGNSLISRFGLNDDIKDKKIKPEIETYKQAVKDYKENVGKKHDVMASIDAIKAKFSAKLQTESKAVKSRNNLLTQYYTQFGTDGLNKELQMVCVNIGILGLRQADIFGDEKLTEKGNKAKLLKNLIAAQRCVVELESGKMYENAFEWRFEFPEVLDANGDYIGFDVVIGNPPYIKEREAKAIFKPLRESAQWLEIVEGKMDLWYFFLHLSFNIAKKSGVVSVITNAYWMKSDGSKKLINRIYNYKSLNEIVYFDDYPVFEEVSGKHMIHSYINAANDNTTRIKIVNIDKSSFKKNIESETPYFKDFDSIVSETQINISNEQNDYFENCKQLGELFFVTQGVVEAPDKLSRKMIFEHKTQHSVGEGVFVVNKGELDGMNLSLAELAIVKPYLNPNNVVKYGFNFNEEYLFFLDKENREKVTQGDFPNVKLHLDKYTLFITSSNAPYGLHRDRSSNENPFEKPKLICKGMFASPEFTYDDNGHYVGFSFSVINEISLTYSLKYLLSLMNSKLGQYWFQSNGKKRGVGVDIGVKVFRQFPVKEANKDSQELFIELVDKILNIKSTNPNTDTSELENQIDQMVYKLYELTYEEVKIIDPDFHLSMQEYEALIKE